MSRLTLAVEILKHIGASTTPLPPSWRRRIPWWPSKIYPMAEHEAWFKAHYGIKGHFVIDDYLLAGGDYIKVYVDECHNYIKNDPKIQVILAEARQQKVGVILAHQFLGQIDHLVPGHWARKVGNLCRVE